MAYFPDDQIEVPTQFCSSQARPGSSEVKKSTKNRGKWRFPVKNGRFSGINRPIREFQSSTCPSWPAKPETCKNIQYQVGRPAGQIPYSSPTWPFLCKKRGFQSYPRPSWSELHPPKLPQNTPAQVGGLLQRTPSGSLPKNGLKRKVKQEDVMINFAR